MANHYAILFVGYKKKSKQQYNLNDHILIICKWSGYGYVSLSSNW